MTMDQTTQQYRYFINSLTSEATRRVYSYSLGRFCKDLKLDDYGKILELKESQIIDYVIFLKNEKGYSIKGIDTVLSAIFHFFEMNDVVLNRKKIKKFIGKQGPKKYGRRQDQGYSREQIHKMLQTADERVKALILLLASSGLRIGAIPGLKVKDVTAAPKYDLYQVSVYDGEYITYCTPEASRAIHDYLEYRKRCGEKIEWNSPLFRDQFNREDPFKTKKAKFLTLTGVQSLVLEFLIKTGIRERERLTEGKTAPSLRKQIPLCHGFRKFFNTALMNTDVHPSFKKLLMGHSVELDEVYYDKGSEKSQAKLLEEYYKAVNELTINEENRLRIQVEELTVKKDQMDRLQAQVDRLQKLIK